MDSKIDLVKLQENLDDVVQAYSGGIQLDTMFIDVGLYMVDFTKHETLGNTKGMYC